MLRLIDIKKDYVMKDQEPVHALKGVNINFRRNEFVAILGPSGCGKTTLLNIIGGLDHYTSGDLFIQGVSTKDYNDHDWDTYRNHSIGFVFQSYNLISHSNILSNVELALTISGIDKKERRERALKALETVGLQGMEKKKPNQLSGGQMQRVAIARALVNNPEILLADEPTGALDSETSVQIMDLLKEVAKDRLVIMVTHNPDLAEKYATRIVTMKDGLLTGDSAPYEGESEEDRKKAKEAQTVNKGNKAQTNMTFPTATRLSFFNLLSKLKRTILISIAGSIGIIGVSSVLSVSTGVHGYIDDMQDDLISRYPFTIAETAVDYATLLEGLSNSQKQELVQELLENEIGLDSLINYLMDRYKDFTKVKTNDINDDLMHFVSDLEKKGYTHVIQNGYNIDMTNNFFTNWQQDFDGPNQDNYISLNGLTQMYIAELRTVPDFSEYANFVDLFTDFMKEMPDNKDYILSQYDILDGEYPSSPNDIVIVVDDNKTLTDLIYAQMGYFSEKDFLNVALKAVEEHSENPDPEKIKKYDNYKKKFTYEEIRSKKFKYYKHDDIWSYKTQETETITFKIHFKNGDSVLEVPFTLSYQNATGQLEGSISFGNYSIPCYFEPVSGQKEYDPELKPNYDKFIGRWNGRLSLPTFKTVLDITLDIDDSQNVSFDVNSVTYYSTKENAVSFNFDYNGTPLTIDLAYDQETDTLNSTNPKIPISATRYPGTPVTGSHIGSWLANIGETPFVFTLNELNEVLIKALYEETTYEKGSDTVEGFMYEANQSNSKGEECQVSCILKKKKEVQFGCLNRGVYYSPKLTEKFISDNQHSRIVEKGENNNLSLEQTISSHQKNVFQAYVTFTYSSFSKGDPDNPIKDVPGYAYALNTDLTSSLSNMFSVVGKTETETNIAYLRSLSGMAAKEVGATVQGAVYEFKKLPSKIQIFPKDFSNKEKVCKYLDTWNADGDITLDDGTVIIKDNRQELTYTDTVELIVSIINTMIDIITIALISFTSLALVVSCFMIAVITYISTMERVKEIGVIRSLGGRKKDVSRLFIAECLIIGLASGVIGIGVTYLLSGVLNLIVSSTGVGVNTIARLPIYNAGLMIALSIFLNVMSGLIPARSASKQDPVIALRSE